MKNKKIIALCVVGLAVAAAGIAYSLYAKIFSANTAFNEDKKIVFVFDSISLESWLQLTENAAVFKNTDILLKTGQLKKFNQLKPGRYAIRKGMNSSAIINLLRSGTQEPIRFRTDNVTTLEALAGKLGKNMRYDSLSYIRAFRNPENYPDVSFNDTTIACIIKPNTYEFYWTITPEQFMDKMKAYHEKFWTEERLNKAKQIGLNKNEVVILASIVKAETMKTEEAPKIAGLYLNRLRIGKALQSDPTAVFGAGLAHVQRVKNEIAVESAYNTYKRIGLPPGPINFPEDIYIDAVLQPENHNYLYMCAQPGGTGFHNFSKTFEQHIVYATQYRKWLNQQGIK